MNRSHSRSAVFLMEIIAAVLFFSLTGALCLEMFAKSHEIQLDTRNLNTAANEAGNAAELLKHAASPPLAYEDGFFPECLADAYPYMAAADDTAAIYYDGDWNHCGEEAGVYCMEITQLHPNSVLAAYQIKVRDAEDGGDAIYALDLKLHIPKQN